MQQQLAKQTKLIAALKQHYERYHAEDLAVLKELYEYHAQNCVRAAGLTVDPGRREEYLKLAREWTQAATALQALTRSNLAARPRLAYVSTKKTTQTLDPLRSQKTYEDLEKLRKARAR